VSAVWALHGFLGQGQDWRFLRALDGVHVHAHSMLSDGSWTRLSLLNAGRQMVDQVRASGEVNPVVVGYSMGARVALHAMLAAPGLFRHAVLVAPHLGFENEESRRARIQADDAWARRFESTEDWEPLLAAWDAQPVFGGRPGPQRLEASFERAALAEALRHWSLGRQTDLGPRLAAMETDITWVCGAQDEKFLAQARRGQGFLPASRLLEVPGVGHRVPHEAPEQLFLLMKGLLG
jgi:2-succinyl-6-hydroxy-2,4-cyclohexadiene-1-carboxylate synthase